MNRQMDEGFSYKSYWLTWLVLLGLTLAMILADEAGLGRAAVVAILLAAMLTKAGLIVGNFMHLRFEKLGLVLAVVLGISVTAGILFCLVAPDGFRVLRLSH